MTHAAAALPAAFRDKLRWLSLVPFDQSTEQGRASERHRRVALTAAAAALAKLISVSTTLISVPLTLHYLGAERFGMWMAISSLIAMLVFADLGIGNGVLNAVAQANGRGDRAELQRVISSGFLMLSAVALVIAAVFAVAYGFVPWHKVLNVNTALARQEAGPAVAVLLACFSAAIPLALVQRVQMGLQQGFAASLWQCAGSILALASVLLVIELKAGLPWLVLGLAGAPVVALALNGIHFCLYRRPELRPRLGAFSTPMARRLAGSGALFFVLQIAVAVSYASDSLVIAQLLGASKVATYAVSEKLFSFVAMAVTMLLSPLWPAYGEAIARGDAEWATRTLRRSLTMAMCASAAASFGLLLLAPELLRWWVGPHVEVVPLLLVGLALWKVLEAGGIAVAMFLNGLNVVRAQVACAIPTAIVAILLKIWLVQQIGIAGTVWATGAAYSLFTIVPLLIFSKRLFGIGRHRAQ